MKQIVKNILFTSNLRSRKLFLLNNLDFIKGIFSFIQSIILLLEEIYRITLCSSLSRKSINELNASILLLYTGSNTCSSSFRDDTIHNIIRNTSFLNDVCSIRIKSMEQYVASLTALRKFKIDNNQATIRIFNEVTKLLRRLRIIRIIEFLLTKDKIITLEILQKFNKRILRKFDYTDRRQNKLNGITKRYICIF